MWRIICAVALGVAVSGGRTAVAQTQSDRDEVRKLEEQVQKLREQVREVQSRLARIKGDSARPDNRQHVFRMGLTWQGADADRMRKLVEQLGGKDGFGVKRMNAEEATKFVEEVRKALDDARKAGGGKEGQHIVGWMSTGHHGMFGHHPGHVGFWHGMAGHHGGHMAFWHGMAGHHHHGQAAASGDRDTDRRLDRLFREFEELRRELRNR
jgi:polyhydroxyalkanoate synthesis regulator phasin